MVLGHWDLVVVFIINYDDFNYRRSWPPLKASLAPQSLMKILVTGGAGFIGSHLCERLLSEGHEVICVDNFFTGQRVNVQKLLPNKKFTLVEHDIIEPIYFEQKIDQIYNLACPASPVHYQFNPIRTVKANTVGMINMLGLAKKSGARILQTSTSEVYGDPLVHPQPEGYWGNVNPVGERSCYDEGKRVAETLCMDYHREHKLEIRLVRLFNTYGPRMRPDDGRVISNFIVQALANQPITLYGDGSQTRSFCYVDDLVTGLIAMMNQAVSVGPVNLGNPEEISVKKLAEEIVSKTKSKSEIICQPARPDDPQHRQPDISLAKKVLHWQPSTTRQEGLQKTIAYFEEENRK